MSDVHLYEESDTPHSKVRNIATDTNYMKAANEQHFNFDAKTDQYGVLQTWRHSMDKN